MKGGLEGPMKAQNIMHEVLNRQYRLPLIVISFVQHWSVRKGD
jgi:hypothetical protein